MDKRLKTIKLASKETGISRWTFYRLLKEKKLTKYKVHTTLCISLSEFETLATPKQIINQ